MARGRQVVTVRALTMYIKRLIEGDQTLGAVWVKGEISNWKVHTSGHCYFTLKDDAAQVKCVLFRSQAARLRFVPEHGMRVICGGAVSVYERDGGYQLYVEEMEPDGVGALHLAFEQLKQKLAAEGLFAEPRKRPLPLLPRKVGLVTSPTGAAVRDMVTVARRRFPNVHLILAPALVQGAGAPASLTAALDRLSRVPGVDVIIMGRGGGSLEELWAFNDEGLTRAIAACPVPVVSGVGHETDFTIADFVADLRAPTPSAAAELAVPAKAELRGMLRSMEERLTLGLRGWVGRKRERLDLLAGRAALRRPLDRVRRERQRVDDLTRRLELALGTQVRGRRALLKHAAARLDALSPLGVLQRGYAIALDAQARVLRDAAQVAPGDRVQVILRRGRLNAVVAGTDPAEGE